MPTRNSLFSNPPYAARAYAYVSAAQYDALVTAYHFKNLYNRPAPYTLAGIQALVPKSALPSYPSEDAVVAGATVEILKLLFPTEVSYIEQQAADEMQYRIMAGANVRGELTAGEDAGRAGGRCVCRPGPVPIMPVRPLAPLPYGQRCRLNATSRGDVYWQSLELPLRPPMLPLFGKVIPFLFDTLTVKALRPGPPNLVGSAAFKTELAEVLSYSANPTRANQAIVQFWADGAGTYTPPGHWNAIAASEFVKQNYSEVRCARNFALMNMAEMDAAVVCWNTKYFYFNERPTQANPTIKTLTGVPNFPPYISGHATFSGAAASVLTYLLPR